MALDSADNYTEELGWRKGPWTPEEDKLLNEHITLHGEGRWNFVPRHAGLNRSGKSCRLRWVNYLRPGLKKGQMNSQEEAILIELHALWGNKWSRIARYLPGRTDNEIKNYWRTHFKNKDRNTEKTQTRRSQFMKQKKRRKVIDEDVCSSAAATILTSDHDPGNSYNNNSTSSSNTYAPNFPIAANNIIDQQRYDQEYYYDIPFMSSDVPIATWARDNSSATGHDYEQGSLWNGLWNMELEVAAATAAHHQQEMLQNQHGLLQ